METLFIPAYYKKELEKEFLEKISEIPFKKIGLFTTVQFLNQLKQLEKSLQEAGKEVFIGKTGQVLGCNISSPKSIESEVECFVYLGSGKFHQLNLAIQTDKPIYQANPITKQISELDKKELERYQIVKRETVKKAKSAKVFGILVSTKPGQFNLELAEKTKKQLEAKEKEAHIFVFETIDPNELLNFPQIQAWINTACPRIALDDIERFDKPIINPEDLV